MWRHKMHISRDILKENLPKIV